MPFNIGLTGLNAAAADLRVTGNNIANAGTTGFKYSRAEFADIYASTYGGMSRTSIGSGVRLQNVAQQHAQGSLEFTDNGLDMAINGQGFFVLNRADNTQAFTRNGEFKVDRNGFVVSNDGARLQGFQPVREGGINNVFNTGLLQDIQLPAGDTAPLPTTEILAKLNLAADFGEDDLIADPFDPTDPETYNYSTSLTVYDSLGIPRTMTLFFVRNDPLEERTWTVLPRMLSGTGADPDDWVGDGELEITFDEQGNLEGDTRFDDLIFAAGDFDPNNGAAALEISMDFAGTTQHGTRYAVNSLQQDGYTVGRLAGIDIDQSGVVFARYTNGRSEVLAQVALANFTNPQGLAQLGDNNWAESFAAGPPAIGAPTTGDLGQIQAGALENSNVNLAQQLVQLITAQRNFQANAQTISAADTITQTIINIR